MNNFMETLENEDNIVRTGNGEFGHSSTLNSVLDFNNLTGNSRLILSDSIRQAFNVAYSQNPVLATKSLFHSRDVLEGGGDKKLGRISTRQLVDKLPTNKLHTLFNLMVKYGSYKDLVLLLGQRSLSEPIIKSLVEYLDKELKLSSYGSSNSRKKHNTSILVAKYMPTETTKSSVMKLAYQRFIDRTNYTRKEYRKQLTKLRKNLNLVETKLTESDYGNIDYSKVPSQAMKKYMTAFFNNDHESISEFLTKVNEGESKINTKTLEPYQLVGSYLNQELFSTELNNLSLDEDSYLTTLWDNLPKQESNLKSLPIIDVSASMTGLPMEVAVSLGMYLSENNNNVDYGNKFITFSNKPNLISFPKNAKLSTKIRQIVNANWDMNTNLERVFDLILNTSLKGGHTQKDMPDILTIISDMSFDSATYTGDDNHSTFFEKQKRKFEKHGYNLPFIVFWNVDGDYYGLGNNTNPVVKDTPNTCQISGFSKNVFSSVLNLDLEELKNYTPEKVLFEALNSERYKDVEKLFE